MDKVTPSELIESLSQGDKSWRKVFREALGILALIALSPFIFMMFCLDWMTVDPNTKVWQDEYY